MSTMKWQQPCFELRFSLLQLYTYNKQLRENSKLNHVYNNDCNYKKWVEREPQGAPSMQLRLEHSSRDGNHVLLNVKPQSKFIVLPSCLILRASLTLLFQYVASESNTLASSQLMMCSRKRVCVLFLLFSLPCQYPLCCSQCANVHLQGTGGAAENDQYRWSC